eukprot:XP_001706458.1 Hypothetical protein GL50803_37532 [Giardia lamblia ATCC 50803]
MFTLAPLQGHRGPVILPLAEEGVLGEYGLQVGGAEGHRSDCLQRLYPPVDSRHSREGQRPIHCLR